MRTALVGVDVVGEGEQGLLVGVVPLHGDLDLADVARLLDVDDLLVQPLAGALAVQVLDEVDDAAVVLETRLEALAALVPEVDLEALGEERHLAEALLEDRAVVVDRLEDLEIRHEGDAGPAAVGRRALLERPTGLAALVGLAMLVAVPPDREVEVLGERVDHGHAHTVQTTRDLVAAAVAELAARVEHCEHDLGRGAALLLHHLDRDAAAVVADRDADVRVDHHLELVGLAGERLVDRVVDNLVDQVMQAAQARRPDVHPGPLANGLEALEHGDVLGAIGSGVRGIGGSAGLGGTLRRVVALGPIAVLGLFRQAVPSIERPASRGHCFDHEKPRRREPSTRAGGGT